MLGAAPPAAATPAPAAPLTVSSSSSHLPAAGAARSVARKLAAQQRLRQTNELVSVVVAVVAVVAVPRNEL
jgi:hypothetical protein